MANTPEKPQLSEEERAELKAMIAAGRELSPEMDESLIESYVERRAAEQRAKMKLQGQNHAVAVPQPSGHPFAGVHPAVAIAGMVTMAAVFVVIMLATQGQNWWLIFPLFAIFGGWMGGSERHRHKMERRAQRYQMRADYYRARMGYPPRDGSRRLPESEGSQPPPPVGMPAQPPEIRDAPRASAPPPTSPTGGQPPVNPAG
jgi:Spy/CpxP family protein refolding chaperone